MGWVLKGLKSGSPRRFPRARELRVVARSTERNCEEMKKSIGEKRSELMEVERVPLV